jgi:hypothetical protein
MTKNKNKNDKKKNVKKNGNIIFITTEYYEFEDYHSYPSKRHKAYHNDNHDHDRNIDLSEIFSKILIS